METIIYLEGEFDSVDFYRYLKYNTITPSFPVAFQKVALPIVSDEPCTRGICDAIFITVDMCLTNDMLSILLESLFLYAHWKYGKLLKVFYLKDMQKWVELSYEYDSNKKTEKQVIQDSVNGIVEKISVEKNIKSSIKLQINV